MQYLLDTHVIIWLTGVDEWKLSPKSKEIILHGQNDLYLSVVSIWEIALKVNKNKLNLGISMEELIEKIIKSGINITSLSTLYILGLASLPNFHSDPFDRLIVSTALAENLVILTADDNLKKYPVKWAW